MRILNIVLVEYLDELKDAGLCFETVVDDQPTTDQPATDQPIITKKRVMECLQQIGQHELAEILSKKQGEICNSFEVDLAKPLVRFTTLTYLQWCAQEGAGGGGGHRPPPDNPDHHHLYGLL